MYFKYGSPLKLLSDRGTHFDNKLVKALCTKIGIEKIFTTPYHPEANGLVEHWNSTILNMLRTLTEEKKKDWDDHVGAAAFAYNTSKHAMTGYSPYFLLFGIEPRIPLDTVLQRKAEEKEISIFMGERLERLQEALLTAKKNSEKKKHLMDL